MVRVEVEYHDGDVEILNFASVSAANTFLQSVRRNPDVRTATAMEVNNG